MRANPLRAVLRAPPDTWGWGAPEADRPEQWGARPGWQPPKGGSHWLYDKTDNDKILCHAAPFRGRPAE